MANHCYNWITIEGLKEGDKQKIIKFLGTYEKYNYMTDWVESYITEEHQLEGDCKSYKYGAKWFDVAFNLHDQEEESFLDISGDSAWGPMTGLAQALSSQHQCSVRIEYEECGSDFGGCTVYSNGDITEKEEHSYFKWRYIQEGTEAIFSEAECERWEYTEEGYQEFKEDLKKESIELPASAHNEIREIMGLKPIKKTNASLTSSE